MRVRVVVYVRVKTIKILLAKKGKRWGGQKWLAEQLGISASHMANILAGRHVVTPAQEKMILQVFRGMSHKAGGRSTWSHLFQPATMVGGVHDAGQ